MYIYFSHILGHLMFFWPSTDHSQYLTQCKYYINSYCIVVFREYYEKVCRLLHTDALAFHIILVLGWLNSCRVWVYGRSHESASTLVLGM